MALHARSNAIEVIEAISAIVAIGVIGVARAASAISFANAKILSPLARRFLRGQLTLCRWHSYMWVGAKRHQGSLHQRANGLWFDIWIGIDLALAQAEPIATIF